LIDLLHCDSAAEAAKIFAADWQPGTPAVVLCPSLVTPQALLRAFDAGAKPASVASVVVCVSSHTAVVSGRCRTQPGLLDSLAEAACSVVRRRQKTSSATPVQLARIPQRLVEDPAAAELSRLLRLVNAQSARVIRAPQGRLPATTGAAALIPPEVPSWRQLIRQQRRQPRQLLLSSELDLGWLGLSRVSVTFSRPLERDKLADRLRMLSAGSQKTKRPTQQAEELLQSKFYYVSGIAPVKQGNSKPQWLRFWRHCAADSSCLLPAKAKSDAAFTTAKVVAFGRGLETEDLKRMLRLCAPLKPTRRALMIRSDLTPAAVARIHKERHLDPLPEGWFFNGTKYISFDGESSKTHPSLEKFLESHIAEENKKIAEYNAKLAAGSEWRDLFDN
uniref:Flavodoxin-like domain-containing protein n=1 Tax=Macrostomum lignano TaxID=282301 RepID=A0A1I8IH99_9PLAT